MFPIPMTFRVVAKTVEQRTYNGPNGENRPYWVRRVTCLDENGLPWFVGWPDPKEGQPPHVLDVCNTGDTVDLQICAVEEDKGAIRARAR